MAYWRFFLWKLEIYKAFKSKIIFCDNYFIRNKANYKINSLLNSIKVSKNKFIIPTVNKARYNLCIICKVFYKKYLLNEYLGNSTKAKLTSPISEIKNRLISFSRKLKFHISSLTFPYLFNMTKFHRNSVKFRFVTWPTNSFHAGNFFSIY